MRNVLKTASAARVLTVFAVLLCLYQTAQAQHFSVTGSVGDSTGTALSQATVVVLARSDIALVQFGVSRGDGTFILRRLVPGEYILQVSHVGYQTLLHNFDVHDADVDVGHLELSMRTQALEEFVVTSDRLPFIVRGDTIEYNALAFIVRPQDMVEDLLRRLPGIEVDPYGTVIAHGEVVQNMLVEGKEFFGTDPAIATRNLPADAVEKVQVYDKPSDQAELTGIPDGQDEKTINLGLTEESKRGAFGQTTGGLGAAHADAGRYFGQVSAFRFAPKTQLALIGSAENVNQPGFSGRQLSSFAGSGSALSFGRRQDGLSESLGAGVNVSQDFGENTTFNASYFLTDLNRMRERTVGRDQLLGSAISAFSDESDHSDDNNFMHVAVLNAESRLGEGHDVVLRGTWSKAISTVARIGQETTTDAARVLLNETSVSVDDDRDNVSGSVHVTWRKRVSDSGRSLIAEGLIDLRDNSETKQLYTESKLYRLGDLQTREEQRQEQYLLNDAFSQAQRIELLQPLRTGRTLKVYVQRSASEAHLDKAYFDLVGNQSVRNTNLSETFQQHREYWRSGTAFHFRNEAGSRWASTEMKV